jgi:hypothetical protein
MEIGEVLKTMEKSKNEHRKELERACRDAVAARLFLDIPVRVLGGRHPDQLEISKGAHNTTTKVWGGIKRTIQDPRGNHLTMEAEVKTGKKTTCHLYLSPDDGEISDKHFIRNLTWRVEMGELMRRTME